MSDFILTKHPQDVELNGVQITNLEHADDSLTASPCTSEFQMHFNEAQQ
jgi:hypothetical protein